MSRFARLLFLAVLIGSGCNQTSPVLEYNAAMQAIDREIEWQKEAREVINSGAANAKQKEEMEQKIKRSDDTIEALSKRIPEIRSRL